MAEGENEVRQVSESVPSDQEEDCGERGLRRRARPCKWENGQGVGVSKYRRYYRDTVCEEGSESRSFRYPGNDEKGRGEKTVQIFVIKQDSLSYDY